MSNSRFVSALRMALKFLVFFAGLNAHAAQEQTAKAAAPANPSLAHQISSLNVPRMSSAPKLADFEGMEPASALARKMLKVEKFIQRDPKDGVPVILRSLSGI